MGARGKLETLTQEASSDLPGGKYQARPGDYFLEGAGVLFSAGAGDLWSFSKRFNQTFCLKTLGDPFFSAPNPTNATLVQ